MTAITIRADHETRSSPVWAEQEFGRVSIFEGDACVERARGELDVATRDRLFLARTARPDLSVMIDLWALTHMDCDGYCGTVAVPIAVEADTRTQTLRSDREEPARLLGLVGHLERQPPLVSEPAHPADVSGFVDQAPPRGETA